MTSPQIITVSGLPGSGTSTACDTLCEKLGWAYVNAGRIFRELAEESGLSLAEFGERAEVDGRWPPSRAGWRLPLRFVPSE